MGTDQQTETTAVMAGLDTFPTVLFWAVIVGLALAGVVKYMLNRRRPTALMVFAAAVVMFYFYLAAERLNGGVLSAVVLGVALLLFVSGALWRWLPSGAVEWLRAKAAKLREDERNQPDGGTATAR